MQKEQQLEFDFSRNDKLYSLTIPSFSNYGDVILYQVKLRDLVTNRQYAHCFRFKQLKQYHESLLQLKLQLPEFPKTHFWSRTNKNPQMIEQRRAKLESYFQIVLNDPFTRGYSAIKKMIRIFKVGQRLINRPNSARFKSSGFTIEKQRAHSGKLSNLKTNYTISSPLRKK